MPNPETHTCPNCGYVWRHGQDGSHSCTLRLVARVAELEAQLSAPIKDDLDGLLDAILTAPSREIQRKFLQMIRADAAYKTRMAAHALIQDALSSVTNIPTPDI